MYSIKQYLNWANKVTFYPKHPKPKSAIYTPKGDDGYPHHCFMGAPPVEPNPWNTILGFDVCI